MKGTHVLPLSVYARNFAALVVLMVLTVAAARFDVGDHIFTEGSAAATFLNNAIAMGIAVTKATLVILFFMGVKYTTRLVQMWAIAGFAWALLLMITYGDYSTRKPVEGWAPSNEVILGVKQFPGPVNKDFKPIEGEATEGH